MFLLIASMICLNFDIEKNGEHVLPGMLAEYMLDIAKLDTEEKLKEALGGGALAEARKEKP